MTQAVKNVTTAVWPFAIVLLGFVVVQSLLFMVNALKFNKKYKLYSKEDLKSIAKSSAISSIGPSFSVVVVVIAMI